MNDEKFNNNLEAIKNKIEQQRTEIYGKKFLLENLDKIINIVIDDSLEHLEHGITFHKRKFVNSLKKAGLI